MLADNTQLIQSGLHKRNHELQSRDFAIQSDDEKLRTEFHAQKFKNRIVINITQCQSFGSVINITKDENGPMTTPNSEISVNVQFLLGEQHQMYKIISKKIGQIVFQETELPVLLTLALKSKTPEIFKLVTENIAKVDVWEMF
ncbi:proteasome assembly chaperone 3-like [Clytia hemisphaerica]|uniref:Proteasome assembly chaperone 3 n=1 Tax=Clytia hemisphaerica TaxID=252671 RepID=A0A7M5V3A0_9CNID